MSRSFKHIGHCKCERSCKKGKHFANRRLRRKGINFEIPNGFDISIYNKFDLSHKYNLYNVNEFNRIFSEFVMMYYIYANNIYSKYVGTAHYHRYPIESKIDLHRIEDDEIQFFIFPPIEDLNI